MNKKIVRLFCCGSQKEDEEVICERSEELQESDREQYAQKRQMEIEEMEEEMREKLYEEEIVEEFTNNNSP
jgi:galactokinase/mevalonate kinase-like predicted kinase